MTDTTATSPRTATLYRMVLADHVCPYGKRALAMLREAGYEVDDRHLTTREEVDAFKEEHGLSTTPFIRIGEQEFRSSEALADFLAKEQAADA